MAHRSERVSANAGRDGRDPRVSEALTVIEGGPAGASCSTRPLLKIPGRGGRDAGVSKALTTDPSGIGRAPRSSDLLRYTNEPIERTTRKHSLRDAEAEASEQNGSDDKQAKKRRRASKSISMGKGTANAVPASDNDYEDTMGRVSTSRTKTKPKIKPDKGKGKAMSIVAETNTVAPKKKGAIKPGVKFITKDGDAHLDANLEPPLDSDEDFVFKSSSDDAYASDSTESESDSDDEADFGDLLFFSDSEIEYEPELWTDPNLQHGDDKEVFPLLFKRLVVIISNLINGPLKSWQKVMRVPRLKTGLQCLSNGLTGLLIVM